MAVTTITPSKNGRSTLKYALGKDIKDKDGIVLLTQGHNIDPTRAIEQMSAVWKNFFKDDGDIIQTYRIMQSFRESDLDVDNPHDIFKANDIGLALASSIYPTRQVLIVTKTDENRKRLYNQIIVNSIEPIRGKSLRGFETSWTHTVSKANDKVLKLFNIQSLEEGTLRDVAYTPSESALIAKGESSWKATIRNAIDEILLDSSISTIDTLQKLLKEKHNIELILRGKTITYKFSFDTYDVDDQPTKNPLNEDVSATITSTERKVRANKLGALYTLEGIKKRMSK